MGRQGKDREQQYLRELKDVPRMYETVCSLRPWGNDPAALVYSHVLGPALTAFVLWVLREAVGSGKRRLYFLARDGYFMYRIAEIFCERLELPLECRYMSCSRYSLRIPMLHRNREEALGLICRGGIHVTLDKILGRAGLARQERLEVWACLGLPFAMEEEIPWGRLPEVKESLSGCILFLEYMDAHSREEFPKLAGYLKQEGLLEEVPDALVDSGWVGSMQKTLHQVLEILGRKEKPEGYYWGLYELPEEVNPGDYHCYFFSPRRGIGEKVRFNNCLFEAVYTAPHGMTYSYQETGGVFVPVYGQIEEKRRRWIEKMGEWILAYAGLYTKELKEEDFRGANIEEERRAAGRALSLFMSCPTRAEARRFGSLSFSDDVLEEECLPIAARLNERELRGNHPIPRLLSLSGGRQVRESAWFEGSAVLYGKKPRRHLRQYRLRQYLRYLRKSRRDRKRSRKYE